MIEPTGQRTKQNDREVVAVIENVFLIEYQEMFNLQVVFTRAPRQKTFITFHMTAAQHNIDSKCSAKFARGGGCVLIWDKTRFWPVNIEGLCNVLKFMLTAKRSNICIIR